MGSGVLTLASPMGSGRGNGFSHNPFRRGSRRSRGNQSCREQSINFPGGSVVACSSAYSRTWAGPIIYPRSPKKQARPKGSNTVERLGRGDSWRGCVARTNSAVRSASSFKSTWEEMHGIDPISYGGSVPTRKDAMADYHRSAAAFTNLPSRSCRHRWPRAIEHVT